MNNLIKEALAFEKRQVDKRQTADLSAKGKDKSPEDLTTEGSVSQEVSRSCEKKEAKWITERDLSISEEIDIRHSELCHWIVYFDQSTFRKGRDKAVRLYRQKKLPGVKHISYLSDSYNTGTSAPILFFCGPNSDREGVCSTGSKIVELLRLKKQKCSKGFPSFIYCKKHLTSKWLYKVSY